MGIRAQKWSSAAALTASEDEGEPIHLSSERERLLMGKSLSRCLKAVKSTCVPRPRASVALPLRSGAAAKSSPIPFPSPPVRVISARRPPTVGVARNMLWVHPRPMVTPGATSLVIRQRCRLPTLIVVRNRLSEFLSRERFQDLTIALRLVLPAGSQSISAISPGRPQV